MNSINLKKKLFDPKLASKLQNKKNHEKRINPNNNEKLVQGKSEIHLTN